GPQVSVVARSPDRATLWDRRSPAGPGRPAVRPVARSGDRATTWGVFASMPAPSRVLDLSGATVQFFADAFTASQAAADQLCEALRAAVSRRGRAVLGLATGASPELVYAHLVDRHRTGQLSFADAVTYNLDEYYPIGPLDLNSYRAYMHRHLFGHVDLAPNRAHVLDGTVPEAFVAEHAAAYDRWIAADGGL